MCRPTRVNPYPLPDTDHRADPIRVRHGHWGQPAVTDGRKFSGPIHPQTPQVSTSQLRWVSDARLWQGLEAGVQEFFDA